MGGSVGEQDESRYADAQEKKNNGGRQSTWTLWGTKKYDGSGDGQRIKAKVENRRWYMDVTRRNVIRTRNSKNLDTKNQQLDKRCNENLTKLKLSDMEKG